MWGNKTSYNFIVLGLAAIAILIFFQLDEFKIFNSGHRFKEAVLKEIDSTRDEEAVFSFLKKNIEDLLHRSGIGGTIEAVQYAVSREKLKFVNCHTLLHIIGHESYQIQFGNLVRLGEYLT